MYFIIPKIDSGPENENNIDILLYILCYILDNNGCKPKQRKDFSNNESFSERNIWSVIRQIHLLQTCQVHWLQTIEKYTKTTDKKKDTNAWSTKEASKCSVWRMQYSENG